ncbi:hypothetical protein K443DRAFT_537899, partial [Laccaria amethystina LaAM-08-1]
LPSLSRVTTLLLQLATLHRTAVVQPWYKFKVILHTVWTPRKSVADVICLYLHRELQLQPICSIPPAQPISTHFSSLLAPCSVDDGATSQRILICRPSLHLLAIQRLVADVMPAESSTGPRVEPDERKN